MMNLRAFSAKILVDVIENQCSLSECLTEKLTELTDTRDRAFVQAICFGVCRQYFYLDAIAKQLLQKSLKQKDQDIYLLILIGLYQLIEMRLPDYAAVSETVDAASQLKKIWGKNLINAVLRNYKRQQEKLIQLVDQGLESHYSHPNWMIEKLQHAWPQDWKSILLANNEHPPLSLRVNQRKISRDAYLTKLQAENMTAFPIAETLSGIYLENPVDVKKIPGFFAGEVSVQDGAAQLAAPLLQVQPGQRVLDACAAPGGKTAHILEMRSNDIELIAIDQDSNRLTLIQDNFKRLNLSAHCICADAGDSAWWDGKLFDRILADVPCSASGVIRRHPDIKLLRTESDVTELVVEQTRILTALWPLLKNDGLLVYATCSVFPEENTGVIKSFLAQHPDAREEKIQAHWGKSCEVGKQILPGMHGMDGFYYVCLRKS